MSLIKWEPFGEIDRFFDDFPGRGMGLRGMFRDMAVDLYEDGNTIVAEMSISGMDPEHIDVMVEGEYLRIAGTREDKSERKDKQFYSKEITRGSFERVIHLPEPVQDTGIDAEYKDGILKIVLPKRSVVKKEKVKVNVKK